MTAAAATKPRGNLEGFEVRAPELAAVWPVNDGASVTVLTRIDNRPAGKTLTFADGTVHKTVEAHAGRYDAKTFTFSGSPTEILDGYRALVESLTPTQSIILGDAPEAEAQPYRVLPAKLIDARTLRPTGLCLVGGVPAMARLKENFRPSRLLLLDFDPDERMPASWRSLDEQGRWDLFVEAVPEFSGAARLTIPSGSARVRLPDGSPAKSGPVGTHTYVVMDRALSTDDLDAMRTALVVRLWARGLGFMAESKAGAALKRTLFDSSVWLAGREVFDGPPAARPPLTLAPVEAQMVDGGLAAPLEPITEGDERLFSERTGARVVREAGNASSGADTDARRAPRISIEDHTTLRMDTVVVTEKGPLTVKAFLESGAAKLRCQATFRESSSWNGILRRVGNTAILHDNGTCTTYRINADAEQDAPADQTPEDTSRKLTQGEAESLIAWSWRTNKTLPAAPEQFDGEQVNPQNGKPFERLRVRIGIGDNSGPWCSLGWQSRTSAEFIERADAQIDKRFSKDTGDKETAGPDDFRRHARQWAASVQALEVSDDTARELLARVGGPGGNNTAPLEVAEVADADGSGFPEPPPAIYELSGARRVLFDHYMSASRYPQPLFGVASVSAILATVMGRNYRFWGAYANLMLVMAGPTGCGKEAPQQLADAALTAAGLSSRIGPGSIVSGAGVEDHMEQCPVTLWLLDEMGKMLGAVAQTDQGRAADIAARLMQLYTRSGGVYRGRGLAGLGAGAVKTIHNPICTVLGASTPEAMKGALSAGDAESGFTGRLSFFATNAMRPARRVPTASMPAIPRAFVDWASVAGRESAAGNLPPSGTVPPAPAFDVPSSPDAQALLDRYSAQVDAKLEKLRDPAARSGWVRAFETACKFALIAAVGDDPINPEVRTEHAQWGVAMADHLASTFALSFADRLGTDRHYDALVRLRSIIFRARDFGDSRYRCVTQRGLMPRSYLVKLAKMRSRDLDDLLTTLREAGEVSSGQLDKDLHGMTGAAYWATRGGQDA